MSSTLLKRQYFSKLACYIWHQKREFRNLLLINNVLISIRQKYFLLGRFSKTLLFLVSKLVSGCLLKFNSKDMILISEDTQVFTKDNYYQL